MGDALEQMADALGVTPLTGEEQTLLLDVAREVAHATHRRYAPLSAFLLGAALAGGDVERTTALRDAVTRVRAVLPAAPPDPPER